MIQSELPRCSLFGHINLSTPLKTIKTNYNVPSHTTRM